MITRNLKSAFSILGVTAMMMLCLTGCKSFVMQDTSAPESAPAATQTSAPASKSTNKPAAASASKSANKPVTASAPESTNNPAAASAPESSDVPTATPSASIGDKENNISYYPGVFSEVPEFDVGLEWEIEILSDYSQIEIMVEDNTSVHGFNMQIKYSDNTKKYDTNEIAEEYFEILTASGFAFYKSGELWGKVRNCDFYVYVKDDVYVDVEVFDGSNELNGIIIRLDSGDAAIHNYGSP